MKLKHLLIPMLGILGWFFHLFKKSKRDYKPVTKILNVSISFLLVFNLVQIFLFGIKDYYATAKIEKSMRQTFEEIDFKEIKSRPDIYYIILDAYASEVSMKEIFNYDNNTFSASLKERGFLISNQSRTRYIITHKCLATVLNMEYWTPDKNPFFTTEFPGCINGCDNLVYKI